MIKLDDNNKLVSFHPDSNWFAVYASEDNVKPYICERIAGWALCRLGESAGLLIGVLPSLKDDYQFNAEDAHNFLGYMHADESAARFDAARARYLEREASK